jgi:MFS family permease
MDFEDPPVASSAASAEITSGPWYAGLTRYHWFVLTVAALGWMFDTMDQQLFTLARRPALAALMHLPQSDPQIQKAAGSATMIFMIGWALGGLAFGILGDRIGRAKTMLITIVLYSIFTGLSAFSQGYTDFVIYRFLTGLGVGGEFAVGVALVAEVMPDRARPYALGWLQALSAIGNMTAALVSMLLGYLQKSGAIASEWRGMFLFGVAPALLALPIFFKLKEPERWKRAAGAESHDASGRKLGSLRELFGNPRWRRNTLVGMSLAFAGVVGLWGIGFFAVDLVRLVFEKHFAAQGLSPHEYAGDLTWWAGITSLLQNAGGFLGVYAFSKVTGRIGRKPAFAISFLLAMFATAFTFWTLDQFWQIFVLLPLMGFCQLTLFGGYAIYFPELFPTRLRSTGTSFCYNVGRLIAAVGPYGLGLLTSQVFLGYHEPMRYAGVTMCSVFIIGLIALPFAPETKGQPLPE